jgi:hypothetical protein
MGLEGAHRSSTTSMEGLELIDIWIRGHSITTPNTAWQKNCIRCVGERISQAAERRPIVLRLGAGWAAEESATKGGAFFLLEFSSIAGEGSLGVAVVESPLRSP